MNTRDPQGEEETREMQLRILMAAKKKPEEARKNSPYSFQRETVLLPP
jgi:hypothetical protein